MTKLELKGLRRIKWTGFCLKASSRFAGVASRMECTFRNPTPIRSRTMHVERADAPELLGIKRGAWPLEKVKAEAERLFQLSQEAYVRSSLPPESDRERAERLCVEMISEYHNLS